MGDTAGGESAPTEFEFGIAVATLYQFGAGEIAFDFSGECFDAVVAMAAVRGIGWPVSAQAQIVIEPDGTGLPLGVDPGNFCHIFKETRLIRAVAAPGYFAVAPDVIDAFLKNENVASAVRAFTRDFGSLCGEGKTMLNCD